MNFRDDIDDDLEKAVRSCFQGSCTGMTFDTTNRIVTVQAKGHQGDANATDKTLKPEVVNQIPVVFPYGYLSMMPAGDQMEVELLETASGLYCVSARNALPSGIPTPADGDSTQYSSGGSYTHHDADGDVTLEPINSNKHINLGKNAANYVASSGDSVIGNAAFVTWLNAVAAAAMYPTPWDNAVTPVKATGTVDAYSAAMVEQRTPPDLPDPP